jgi:hypothetical protein
MAVAALPDFGVKFLFTPDTAKVAKNKQQSLNSWPPLGALV